jgi:translation initiation factor 1
MPKKKRDGDGAVLVYESGPEGARSFGPGGKAVDEAGSAASADLPPAEQRLKVVADTRAGHGRIVTVVTGLVLTAPSLDKLAKQLKQSCGTGGTVKGATVELQGDHRERVVKMLVEKGYRVS